MHLGNAWAFLLAWLAVRSAGGTLVLRMEDIDPQRSRPAYARALVEDLRWLGLDWDEGPAVDGVIPADVSDMTEQGPCGPYFQSARTALYDATLDALDRAGLVYPCYCTRKELRQLAVIWARKSGTGARPRGGVPACACAVPRDVSIFRTACWAGSPSRWRTAAAILPCAVPTAWWPTSWPWRWTMP